MTQEILACSRRVKKVARDIAGPRLGFVDCRDLEQDGWVAILQAVQRYDGTTKFATFVELRLRGAMIDGLRRWHPRQRETGESRIDWKPLADRAAETVPASTPSPEDLHLTQELWSLVESLPARQRHVIQRLFEDGAEYKTIAQELQLTKNGVIYLRKLALNDLRWQLTGEA